MVALDVISRTVPKRLKALASRLLAQLGAVAAMAACTFLGYQLHAVTADTSFARWFWGLHYQASRAVRSFFDIDPIYAVLLFPALIVAMLTLGGLYLWRQQDG